MFELTNGEYLRLGNYVNNATKIGVDGIIVQKEWGANHIIVYNPNIIETIND